MAATKYSRATFYLYFNDLHGLLETLLDEVKGGIIGFTPEFDPLLVARALNRMDAVFLIRAFGSHPKAEKESVFSAISHIWLATLYPFDTQTLDGFKSNGSAENS